MNHDDRDIDARLARLSGATETVGPRRGFSNRVMQRIGREPVGTLVALQRPAWRLFPVGVLAAALALVWAASVRGQVNEAMAASDDTELAW